jgi:hypothetical protein
VRPLSSVGRAGVRRAARYLLQKNNSKSTKNKSGLTLMRDEIKTRFIHYGGGVSMSLDASLTFLLRSWYC